MNNHTDFYVRTSERGGETVRYRKCSSCGNVCFDEGDELFNINCNVVGAKREALRKKR